MYACLRGVQRRILAWSRKILQRGGIPWPPNPLAESKKQRPHHQLESYRPGISHRFMAMTMTHDEIFHMTSAYLRDDDDPPPATQDPCRLQPDEPHVEAKGSRCIRRVAQMRPIPFRTCPQLTMALRVTPLSLTSLLRLLVCLSAHIWLCAPLYGSSLGGEYSW